VIRKIDKIIPSIEVMEGAGVKVRRTIASQQLDHLDPFLLLDHFFSDNPDDYIAGFPMHPHRGIETVTYMLTGKVTHKDSLGNAGSIYGGDVQWMTAGGGIMHEEMPEPVDGSMVGFQLWVNLPAKLKMTQPRYQEVSADSIPVVLRDNGVKIKVVSGTVDGTEGAVKEIAAQPMYCDVFIPENASFQLEIPRGHAVFAYSFEGGCKFDETMLENYSLAVFTDGDSIEASTGESSARFLLVAGKPVNEPIARYGPFVMNTHTEIRQALDDLQNGNFVKS